MNETRIITVQASNRVIRRRGSKQIECITSSERGALVTLVMAISATGNSLPSFFIFPRKHFKNHFLKWTGCVGAANPSGCMNAKHFSKFLVFFQSHVRASVDHLVLFVLNNHILLINQGTRFLQIQQYNCFIASTVLLV